MSPTCDEIVEAAIRLSEADRLAIIDRLMETLPDDRPGLSDDSPELAAELERRAGDHNGAVRWNQLRNEHGTP